MYPLPRARLRIALLVVVCLSACAPAGRSGTYAGQNLISASEIEAGSDLYVTAYDIVEHLRPFWPRGVGDCDWAAPRCVTVYRNDARFGGVDELRNITAREVREIAFLRAARARAPEDDAIGVIVVRTK